MKNSIMSRREAVVALAAGLGGVVLAGCDEREEGGDVTANEDLMREHGVIRRALFVYLEVARRARTDATSIPLSSVSETATLFRTFAEDYHERALEEAHIFPVVRKIGSPVAQLPDVLVAQHQRGREITDYILRVARGGSIARGEVERFATTLEQFVAMYGPHAAREDTELFPAWKAALGDKAYEEMGEQFEDIEHKTFGRDGFDDALARIAAIEQTLGLAKLDAVTAPAPPAP